MNKSGLIEQNEIWSGTINITGDVRIATGAIITVLPGSKIVFNAEADYHSVNKDLLLKYLNDISPEKEKPDRSKCLLIVHGGLVLCGERDNVIEIGNEGWGGSLVIATSSKDKISLKHCRIKNAYCAIEAFSEVELSDCELISNKYGVASVAKVVIENSAICGNENGIICMSPGSLRASGNNISGNKNAGVYCCSADAFMEKNMIGENDCGISVIFSKKAEIYSNVINNNNTAISLCEGKDGEIKNNVIKGSEKNAIALVLMESVKVLLNVLESAGRAILCERVHDAEISFNEISNTMEGVELNGDTHCEMHNNSFADIKNTALHCSAFSISNISSNSFISSNGIRGRENSQALIEKNAFSTTIAIEAGGLSQLMVVSNEIEGKECGVRYLEQAEGIIEKNRIGCGGTGTGIEIGGMVEIEIKGNEIEKAGKGIVCNEETELRIEGNKIGSDGSGIYAFDASRIEVKGNEIRSEKENCIALGISAIGEIESNVLGGQRGIEAGGLSRALVKKNKIVTVESGVRYREQAGGVIEGNEISGSLVGIDISGMVEIGIKGNEITGTVKGIMCDGETEIEIEGNRIRARENSIDGLGASEIRVKGNVIESEGENCIFIRMNVNAEIEGNELSGKKGIEADGLSQARVIKNVIRVEKCGIKYLEQAGGVMEGNEIEGGEEGVGIEVGGIVEIGIRGNKIRGKCRGIICDGEAGATIEGNDIKISDNGIEGGGAANIIIRGNEIESEGHSCVNFVGTARGEVEENGLRGDGGIKGEGQSRINAKGNRIRVEGCGIRFMEQAEGEAESNEISGGIGIEAGGMSRARSLSNEIEGKECGVRYLEQAEGEVERNVISGAMGIEVQGVSRVVAKNNTVKSSDCAIRYVESAGGAVHGNKILADETGTGIRLSGIVEIQVTDNVMQCVYGIEAQGSSQVRSAGNTIEASKFAIRYLDESGGVIEGNKIKGREAGVGIGIYGVVDLEIRDNHVSGTGTAVLCLENSRLKIHGNRLNSIKGIEIKELSEAQIDSNEIDIVDVGIGVKDQASATLKKNVISGNNADNSAGIIIDGLSEAEIRFNVIRGVKVGIKCYGESFSKISDNDISADKAFQFENSYTNVKGDASEESSSPKRNAGLGIKGLVRKFVLETYHLKMFRKIYSAVYGLAIWIAKNSLGSIDGVKSVYLRRGMSYKDWVPGSSDIDLFVVIDDINAEKDISLGEQVRAKYYFMKKMLPFLGELQIANLKELSNYSKYGDIRAFEIKDNWSLLCGSRIEPEDYENTTDKFRADCATEIINAYKILTDIVFNGNDYINAKQLLIKLFIDIQKYSLFLRAGTVRKFSSRTEILRLLAGDPVSDPGFTEFAGTVEKIWAGNLPAGRDFFEKIYLFTSVHIEKLFLDAGKSGVTGDRLEYYGSECLPEENDVISVDLAGIDRYCEGIRNHFKDGIVGIILDNPGLLYLVIKDDEYGTTDFLSKAYAARDYIETKGKTRNTPFVILSRSIFQMLLFSNHLEMPFNYFKLSDKDKHFLCEANEERWQVGLKRSSFFAPNDRLLYLLIRETIAIISISIRALNATAYSKKQLLYFFNRILCSGLALERKIIAAPPIKNVIGCYCRQYPDEAGKLEAIYNKYLSKTEAEVAAMPSGEIIRECYPVMNSILAKLNAKIAEGNKTHDGSDQRERVGQRS